MPNKRKIIIASCLLVGLFALQYTFSHSTSVVKYYSHYFFHPWQSIRNKLFGSVGISIGDILYLIGVFIAIFSVGKWIILLRNIKKKKFRIFTSLLNAVITISAVYFIFLLSWGGNYYKPELTAYWQLHTDTSSKDSLLIVYNKALISQLNELAKSYSDTSKEAIPIMSEKYYQVLTNTSSKTSDNNVKATLFSTIMQYMGIQGYYNPFTGEAQINKHLPVFMLPFVTTHEMAHQQGIAAEDDANLLAFAICERSGNNSFQYSGAFNVFLYAHSRLKKKDSLLANELLQTLNPLSHQHLDTLRAIRLRYKTSWSTYTTSLYDKYLKFHNQKNGISSYSSVVFSAAAWQAKEYTDSVIRIP